MIVRILAAAAMIGLTVVGVEFAPPTVFLIVVTALAVAVLYEVSRLLESYSIAVYLPTYLLTAAYPWLWVAAPEHLPAFVPLTLLIVFCWSIPAAGDLSSAFPTAAANFATVFFIGSTFAILAAMQRGSGSEIWIVFITVWVADSSALFVGRRWGTRKITPRISPNKSLQGYLAALAGAIAAAPVTALLLDLERTVLFWTAAGLSIGVFAILGDLFESVIKRGANKKDSASLIPGHGGLFDRFDSLLFAVPAYYLLTRLVE